ncbi:MULTISPECIES: SDR family NAD(P)-dependent oxidoreductase [Sinorhizobium]|uniref:SDR family NAD(P)-dependent oxidoreductase n=1 Tax=Sinorhizobium TaxID=28105 RepID=UPI000BE8693F|nr:MULTISPECIES: SDR family NAD(P)-dependent oxidoreductase [Sinorhizobium]PDT50933.1 3-hydroxyacyl-CoA dehydrogenase [Sinorhizobium sp. NG07B]POH25049.1 hypothetical protein ATY30_28850 [Sinorhizobium americanum]
MKITGKTAIVTGAGSGLGKATAIALAEAGAKLAIFDVNEEALRETARATGGRAYAGDVASAHDMETAFLSVAEHVGSPQILVNCAGILGSFRAIADRPAPPNLERFQRVVNVNLVGTFNTMRLFAQHIFETFGDSENEQGVIVNTASIAAYDALSGQAGYAASKGGVAAMTLPAARELGSLGIRVIAVAPGMFDTSLAGDIRGDVLESLIKDNVFPRRLGRPAEFAELVLHIIHNPIANGSIWRFDAASRMRDVQH